jgi:hypothetical protein
VTALDVALSLALGSAGAAPVLILYVLLDRPRRARRELVLIQRVGLAVRACGSPMDSRDRDAARIYLAEALDRGRVPDIDEVCNQGNRARVERDIKEKLQIGHVQCYETKTRRLDHATRWCSACGHVWDSEVEVPEEARRQPTVEAAVAISHEMGNVLTPMQQNIEDLAARCRAAGLDVEDMVAQVRVQIDRLRSLPRRLDAWERKRVKTTVQVASENETFLNVGRLRAAIAGVPDETELVVRVEDEGSGDRSARVVHAEVQHMQEGAPFLALDCCEDNDDAASGDCP